jgi:uncharacterized MnhB-related membrane protein
MSNISILNALIIAGILAAGAFAAFTKDKQKGIIALITVGVLISVEFFILRAFYVLIAEIIIGVFLTPLIIDNAYEHPSMEEIKAEEQGE